MSDSAFIRQCPQRQPALRLRAPKNPAQVTSAELIPPIRDLAESLKSASEGQLRDEWNLVRRAIARGQAPDEPHLLMAGLALATEALRRTVSVTLYDVQLLAAIALSRRCVVEMHTGEGRTLVAATAALHLSLSGRGVHVITPNVYLAERDYGLAVRIAAPLGVSVGLLPEGVDTAGKTLAYDADVTYGPGHEFGLDSLRDQWILRQQPRQKLGPGRWKHLAHEVTLRRATMQRGLAYGIIDEAECVLIDDAGAPLILSFASKDRAPDADAHLIAKALTEVLQPNTDFLMEPSTGRIALTEAGVQRCHADDVAMPVLQLLRPWTEYVIQALRARFLFRRGVHYVIQKDEVRIVNEVTGRIFEDRSWQAGLHQAIAASQNLRITAEKQAVAQMTRQEFFRLYENLSGLTGAGTGCEQELSDVYALTVETVPLRVPSQRVVLPTRFFVSNAAKYQAIAQDIVHVQQLGRAVLVGTCSASDSEMLAEKLASLNIKYQLLNGLHDDVEADIISLAGSPRSVTIATNSAGRGTEIPLHSDVKANGGLHVIVAECQTSSRRDQQLIGRCARQGDPGSAQTFASAEDSLIAVHGPWLVEAMHRDADENGEVDADFSAQMKRIRASAERQQHVSRINMLRRDIARNSLFRSMK